MKHHASFSSKDKSKNNWYRQLQIFSWRFKGYVLQDRFIHVMFYRLLTFTAPRRKLPHFATTVHPDEVAVILYSFISQYDKASIKCF